VLAGLPLLGLGWYGLVATMTSASVASVYWAFLSALAIWGWFELAFLCGIITGPNVRPCPPGVARWERFLRAWGTIAHSEMALIATAVVMVALCWEAPNPFGLWTFLVLFIARISAKLNVYLGVPNINVEFLPAPVRHLASHFRIAPMNAFFPVAVTALTFAVACWLERALASEAGSGAHIGFALLAALTGLALLEHWLMVLPLQDAKLWRWLMPRPEERPAHRLPEPRARLSEDAHGLR
jgi:putative photosynthetic complex assembly protein 2